jgi:hypothetical protein
MTMNARQRAARVAVQVQRAEARTDATAAFVAFPEPGIVVKRGEVYARKLRDRHLGSLAGACAGLMDLRPGSQAGYLAAGIIGTSTPRVGTIFVAFADGTRHETPLRMGTRAELNKVNAAIARFNAMADAATGQNGDGPAPGSAMTFEEQAQDLADSDIATEDIADPMLRSRVKRLRRR